MTIQERVLTKPAAIKSAPSIKSERIHAIDLLRFFAAMAVVACHWCFSPDQMQPIMTISVAKYGAFGVQLFFIISGFVILMSAQRQDFRGFIAARILRLYPAFWICCTLSALVAFMDPLLGWPEYLYNMTMFPDTRYVLLINKAYWSLVIEAKFYLLISILLLGGYLHRIELVMWAWICIAVFSSSFLMRQLFMAQYACFFIGGCACFLLRQQRVWHRWALLGVAWLVSLQETAREVVMQANIPDTFVSCMLVTVFFIVMLAISQNWLVIPAWKGITTLGAISYPIYLLHQRIAVEMGWTTDNPILLLLAFVWLIVLSWVVHRWGELPLQRWMRRRFDNANTAKFR